jgi:hypothetical protein
MENLVNNHSNNDNNNNNNSVNYLYTGLLNVLKIDYKVSTCKGDKRDCIYNNNNINIYHLDILIQCTYVNYCAPKCLHTYLLLEHNYNFW